MPTNETMYKCIEAERARNGMTIEEFTEAIDVSEKTYRNWRAEQKSISSAMLIKIATLFGCSTDYLLGLSDKVRNA